jgi:hypothetical protein
VEAAVSVAKKEIDNNDEVDAGTVLEFARILEQSCEQYELDDDLDFSHNCNEPSCVADELGELDDLDGVDMPVKEHLLPFREFADIFQYNILLGIYPTPSILRGKRYTHMFLYLCWSVQRQRQSVSRRS